MESIDPVVRPPSQATSADFVQVPVEVPQSLLQDFVLILAVDHVPVVGARMDPIDPAVLPLCQARSVGIAQGLVAEGSTVPPAQVEPQHCQAM